LHKLLISFRGNIFENYYNFEFKCLNDVVERKGHLNFEPVNLKVIAEILIELQLVPTVLVQIIQQCLEEDVALAPLPVTRPSLVTPLTHRGIFAKKSFLNKLTQDILLKTEESLQKNLL
jgi:hypothetical protein